MTKTKLDHALELAAQGFYVFPIVAGKKAPPYFKEWQKIATRDTTILRDWWASRDFNIGISTSTFAEGQALLVVDVDNKGDKHGDETLLRLELEGRELPRTYCQLTPTGGRHLVYRCDTPVRQGANVLGSGLDIRSRGGYIVAAGSQVPVGTYVVGLPGDVSRAPAWLIDRCGRPRERVRQNQPAPAGVDAASAIARAKHYLEYEAPLAVEGQGGDETTYKVAARLKDFGVSLDCADDLMALHWNPRCSPPWDPDPMFEKVKNAYAYGQDPPGVAAPEAVFPLVDVSQKDPQIEGKITSKTHPFDKLNQEFAFTIAGGGSHILWETTDAKDRPVLQHLDTGTFHKKHAAWKMNLGKRDEPVTELWMQAPRRRSYDGLVFMPAQKAPTRFYNLFRGFAYEPASHRYESHPAVEAWLEHARVNICRNDGALFRWFVGYFAHLVQRPWEKPLVALVLRGGKGVGKNAVIERIGALLGGHFLLSSNRRYLVGNFNGHLENLLLFALDEAFWSGDKQAEGQLKDLITGNCHVIEHKGKEPYTVENRTRIAIIGNETWLVPSTHDERRFAVFDVGDGRREDRGFFDSMRRDMETGGYRSLLRYLLDFDVEGLDFSHAPSTTGLLEQKHASLEPLEQWWLDCLTEGRIVAGDFAHTFGAQVECERFRQAFRRYARDRNIRSRIVDDKTFGRIMKKVCPIIVPGRMREAGALINTYRLPLLKEARACWDTFIGHKVEWPAE
ncbi:MAG: bifunctional DNA primase/polymerase [Deltaproteobacteria bacterium]|nr:bifunctional DNA primase/polymerase [Deltaproteobacteria bacterium]